MAAAVGQSWGTPDVREGFLCPICMTDLGNIGQLKDHFDFAHSNEDKATLQSLKDLFGKAKKILIGEADHSQNVGGLPEDRRHESSKEMGHYFEPQEVGVIRNHTEDFRRMRNSRTNHIVMETNRLLIRLDKLISNEPIEPSKRKAYERSVVLWVPDQNSTACNGCRKRFSLAHRRHHCRLCGEIMCTDCSEFITFSYARKLTSPTVMVDDPLDAPTISRSSSTTSLTSLVNAVGESHLRVCKNCKKLLDHRDKTVDQRYLKTTMTHLYERTKSLMDESSQLCQLYQEMISSLWDGHTKYTVFEAQEVRVKLLRQADTLDMLSKKILMLGTNEDKPPTPKSLQLQKAIRHNVIGFLRENMMGLSSVPSEEDVSREQVRRQREAEARITQEKMAALQLQHHTNAQRRENTPKRQQAQPPQSTARDMESGWSPEVPLPFQSSNSVDPLKEQISILYSYIRQAKQAHRYDEVQILESNLRELQDEMWKRNNLS